MRFGLCALGKQQSPKMLSRCLPENRKKGENYQVFGTLRDLIMDSNCWGLGMMCQVYFLGHEVRMKLSDCI